MKPLLLLLTLLATSLLAQLPAGIKMEKDIAYIEGGDEAQKLDIYVPETPSDKPLPLIVHIHGGGWRAGTKFPCPVAAMVLKGYAVASVEYRFSQKAIFPAQIQDCQAAIRWLRAHAKQYNFDTDHLGAVGGSAGGHLSALVGTSGGKKAFPPIGGHLDESDRVQAVIDIYGPADFSTVVQQAAEDKNVKNIFAFNTPSDPYSSPHRHQARRQTESRCRQPRALRQQRQSALPHPARHARHARALCAERAVRSRIESARRHRLAPNPPRLRPRRPRLRQTRRHPAHAELLRQASQRRGRGDPARKVVMRSA
jgi:acetyl esterase/lipase